jgi:hypothetical protein
MKFRCGLKESPSRRKERNFFFDLATHSHCNPPPPGPYIDAVLCRCTLARRRATGLFYNEICQVRAVAAGENEEGERRADRQQRKPQNEEGRIGRFQMDVHKPTAHPRGGVRGTSSPPVPRVLPFLAWPRGGEPSPLAKCRCRPCTPNSNDAVPETNAPGRKKNTSAVKQKTHMATPHVALIFASRSSPAHRHSTPPHHQATPLRLLPVPASPLPFPSC